MDVNGNKENVVDAYVVDELWEFWIEFLPTMIRVAAKKFSPRDIKALMDLLDEELEHIDSKDKIVELELKSQEMVAKATNNIMFILITNSSRQLRKKMLEMFVDIIGLNKFKDHIDLKKRMLANQIFCYVYCCNSSFTLSNKVFFNFHVSYTIAFRTFNRDFNHNLSNCSVFNHCI